MIEVYNNECSTLWYYPEEKILYHKFIKSASSELFRETLNKGIEVLKENNAHKWMSDEREAGLISQEDLKWGDDYWRPAAIKAGWKYWAIIMPDRVQGKIMMQGLIDIGQKEGLKVEIFDDTNEAFEWLKSR